MTVKEFINSTLDRVETYGQTAWAFRVYHMPSDAYIAGAITRSESDELETRAEGVLHKVMARDLAAGRDIRPPR